MTSIDLTQIPPTPWGRIAHLFGPSLQTVMSQSCGWLDSSYSRRQGLSDCVTFAHSELLEGVPGDLDSLDRMWYFPWAQAGFELELSLAYALMSMHRASYDHQRRAIELIAVGSHFVSGHVTADAAKAWYSSTDPTPFFSRAMNSISSCGFAQAFNASSGWVELVQKHYWKLSDICHVRGVDNGIGVIQPNGGTFSSLPMPKLDPVALSRSLDAYQASIRCVALLLVAANPVLAVPLPMDEKFGLNGPMSGFYQAHSVERLKEVLGEPLWSSLRAAAEADPTVQSVQQGIESMPDLTDEQWAEQVAEHEKQWGSHTDT